MQTVCRAVHFTAAVHPFHRLTAITRRRLNALRSACTDGRCRSRCCCKVTARRPYICRSRTTAVQPVRWATNKDWPFRSCPACTRDTAATQVICRASRTIRTPICPLRRLVVRRFRRPKAKRKADTRPPPTHHHRPLQSKTNRCATASTISIIRRICICLNSNLNSHLNRIHAICTVRQVSVDHRSISNRLKLINYFDLVVCSLRCAQDSNPIPADAFKLGYENPFLDNTNMQKLKSVDMKGAHLSLSLSANISNFKLFKSIDCFLFRSDRRNGAERHYRSSRRTTEQIQRSR